MIAIEILLTFVYFLECTVVQCKDALPIYWNRHGHECSRIWKLSANFTLIQCIKKVLRCFGARYIGDDIFFRAEIYRGRLLTLMTGSSSRLRRIRFSSDLTVCHLRCMKFKPFSDMDLETKYCYFYHSWAFVPYLLCRQYYKTYFCITFALENFNLYLFQAFLFCFKVLIILYVDKLQSE
jgi:hypothetical protein